MAVDCDYGACPEQATHWLVRYLPSGYQPNPDVRAYCDSHRVTAREARDFRAPVRRVEVVELESARST